MRGTRTSRFFSHASSLTLSDPCSQTNASRLSPFPSRGARPLAAGLLVILLGGCANFSYYVQSVTGQLDIWRRERPVEDVVKDPATPAALKEKLARVQAIREFASHGLALPDNASYRRYADLGRPYVVWNVFAAPEFSVKPVQWCFLFAGCVGYRGCFSKAGADRLAAELAAAGNDAYVGGVPAYSTLGWFPDPVLSTFIHHPEAEIARIVFHELSHQVLYVGDDTMFNESFAVAVEREGMRRWLAQPGNEKLRAGYERGRERREQFVQLIADYRAQLEALYDSALPAP
jgi:predicted aminopeptidase